MRIFKKIKSKTYSVSQQHDGTLLLQRNKSPRMLISYNKKSGHSILLKPDTNSEFEMDTTLRKMIRWAKRNLQA